VDSDQGVLNTVYNSFKKCCGRTRIDTITNYIVTESIFGIGNRGKRERIRIFW
jgi:hypothetical protein